MITTVKDGLIAAMIFVVDMLSLIQDTGQQIDWDVVDNSLLYRRGVFSVRNTTAVVAADTTIAVAALEHPLDAGAVIDWGTGDKIVLTEPALAGAVSITVNPAQSAIADESIGYAQMKGYEGGGFLIPAGTVLAREATSHKMFPRAIRPAAETAECVLLTDAKNESKTDSLTGYGVTYGGIMYENMMPDYTNAAWATFKTELGARFVWKTYRDSRGE